MEVGSIYVEMMTRTKLAETHRDATINEALGRNAIYGRISRHGAKDAKEQSLNLRPEAPGPYRYIGDLPPWPGS